MFDSHAHVAFDQFNKDRKEVVDRAKAAGLSGWIEIGTSVETSKKAVNLASIHDGVFASAGVHPDDLGELREEDWTVLSELVKNPKVVAVGEAGFDYYRGGIFQEQLPAVERFIQLAVDNGLPVIWHIRSSLERDAHEDLIAVLNGLSKKQRPAGVSHVFSGSTRQAAKYLDLGLCIGVSGVVTFKNAGSLPEVVKMTPMDRLLVETDCPFLAPDPYRGQRNEPAYVRYVVQKIAELKGVSFDEVEKATEQNARRLFQL